MWSAHDLIVAPATMPGEAARAVVRLTGDGLEGLLPRLFTPEGRGFARLGEPPRVVAARLAADGLGREWGGIAVEVLHWPGPAGPVGGPLAEVQLPCSAPFVAAVIAEACRHGARLARGGEFTLRGFLAGRLDLVQAEAVLAVVDARTPDELAQGLDRMAGGAGGTLRAVRSGLLDLLADIEAAIDFADESTPDAVPVADAWHALTGRLAEHRSVLGAVAAGLARRDAGGHEQPRVVLVGRPNIGKSSLFNALVGHDAALVANETGTTRDWIEAPMGREDEAAACVLVDLAGLPDGRVDDPVEAAAVAVARAEILRADLILDCRDVGQPVAAVVPDAAAAPRLEVITRGDGEAALPDGGRAIVTSSRTGRGVEELRAAIRTAVGGLPPRSSPATLRMAVGLEAACAALDGCAEATRAGGGSLDEALVASHVRQAVEALGEVTGTVLGADLLDRIFARHCIGK